jgi:hypothetical protein
LVRNRNRPSRRIFLSEPHQNCAAPGTRNEQILSEIE